PGEGLRAELRVGLSVPEVQPRECQIVQELRIVEQGEALLEIMRRSIEEPKLGQRLAAGHEKGGATRRSCERSIEMAQCLPPTAQLGKITRLITMPGSYLFQACRDEIGPSLSEAFPDLLGLGSRHRE